MTVVLVNGPGKLGTLLEDAVLREQVCGSVEQGTVSGWVKAAIAEKLERDGLAVRDAGLAGDGGGSGRREKVEWRGRPKRRELVPTGGRYERPKDAPAACHRCRRRLDGGEKTRCGWDCEWREGLAAAEAARDATEEATA